VRSRSLNSRALRRDRTETLQRIRGGRVDLLRLGLDGIIYPLRGGRVDRREDWGVKLAGRIVRGCCGLSSLSSLVARAA
jgi:hypothetical protein